MAFGSSALMRTGILLLLQPGALSFRLQTSGMCPAQQASFLPAPVHMCTNDIANVESSPASAADSDDASEMFKFGTDRTILTCARCKAAFPINAALFSNQRVRCDNCGHEWFQTADRLQRLPETMELIEYPESMRERMAAGKSPEAQTNFRAFVGNVPFVATEQELQELFEEYGTVTGVSIAKDEDGRPRGFAFVSMEEPEEGNAAIEALNGYMLHDRQLNVSPGKVPPGRGRAGGRGRGGDFRGRGRGDSRGRGDFRGRGRGDSRGRGRGDGRGRGRGPYSD